MQKYRQVIIVALKKCCPHCGKVIDYTDKYCEDCSKKAYKSKKENNRIYNKNIRQVRDKQYTDFYVSKEWKRTTDIIKAKYNGLCIMCLLKENIINVYDVIHHVLEIRTDEGWEHRLDTDGLVPLCHSCHNEVHSNYNENKIKALRDLIQKYKKIYGGM